METVGSTTRGNLTGGAQFGHRVRGEILRRLRDTCYVASFENNATDLLVNRGNEIYLAARLAKFMANRV